MDESREVRMFEPGDFVKFCDELVTHQYVYFRLPDLLEVMDIADKYSRKVKIKNGKS